MQRAKVGAEGLGACLDLGESGAWVLLLTRECLDTGAYFLGPYSC